MKILVTGGAGFIGSNVCEALIKRGDHVHCLDNFITGKSENLNAVHDHPNFTFFEGDIRSLETCQNAIKGCEAVIHLAALGSVPRSIDDPLTANSININGFLNVIESARTQNIQRFIFAASSSTYGDSPSLPKIEDNIGKPLSPYAVGKYVNELYAHVYHLNYGLSYVGLRYFNVFGKNQDPNGAYAAVIPKFIDAYFHGQTPTINGDGTTTRDFTHVNNVVSATLQALDNKNQEKDNEIYNVAFGQQTSLVELTTLIRNELQSRFVDRAFDAPIYGPSRQGDIQHSYASIEKIKKAFGYEPKVDLKEGIRLTVEWFLSSKT